MWCGADSITRQYPPRRLPPRFRRGGSSVVPIAATNLGCGRPTIGTEADLEGARGRVAMPGVGFAHPCGPQLSGRRLQVADDHATGVPSDTLTVRLSAPHAGVQPPAIQIDQDDRAEITLCGSGNSAGELYQAPLEHREPHCGCVRVVAEWFRCSLGPRGLRVTVSPPMAASTKSAVISLGQLPVGCGHEGEVGMACHSGSCADPRLSCRTPRPEDPTSGCIDLRAAPTATATPTGTAAAPNCPE
jgi:hypothetical protein